MFAVILVFINLHTDRYMFTALLELIVIAVHVQPSGVNCNRGSLTL